MLQILLSKHQMSQPSLPADTTPRAVPSHRQRWLAATGWTLAFAYVPQFTPFLVGPLTECAHCVGGYLRFFVITPGFLLANFVVLELPYGSSLPDLLRFIVPSVVLTLIMLAAAVTITASIRRFALILWLASLATLSAFNALSLAAALRA